MTELKPCPFCGENASIRETEGCDYVIECAYCGFSLLDDMDWEELGYNAKKNVSNRWNTRPIEDALRAENERLKKALKEAEDRIFEWNDLSDEG